ncbi:MAG: nucleoside hydrolase, partial [Metallosphaera sp.]
QGNKGSVHPDSLTTYLAYDSSAILEERKFKVDVELCSISRGAMLLDWYSKGRENASVVLKADSEKFYNELISILSSF